MGERGKVIPLRELKKGGWFWTENEVGDLIEKKLLRPTDFVVYSMLCRHAWEGGQWAVITLPALAKQSGVSPRTVCRIIPRLEALGLICRDKRRNNHGAWHINRYDFPTLKLERLQIALEGDAVLGR